MVSNLLKMVMRYLMLDVKEMERPDVKVTFLKPKILCAYTILIESYGESCVISWIGGADGIDTVEGMIEDGVKSCKRISKLKSHYNIEGI